MTNRLVRGVGVNDADYSVYVIRQINGVQKPVWRCPFYAKWVGVLERCYNDKFKESNTSYKDCEIAPEWLLFSNFKKWMELQDWEGKHLDKDILFSGNKLYSPDTCVFVHRKVNNFVIGRGDEFRGEYPLGVTRENKTGRFVARCQNPITGERVYLGLFLHMEDAHLAWKTYKLSMVEELVKMGYIDDERVENALIKRYSSEDFT